MDILHRPGSSWAESLVTTGDPGSIAAPILSAISRGNAFGTRVTDAPIPPGNRVVGCGHVADSVKLPSFSVNVDIGSKVVSTTVGGCIGELLVGTLMPEDNPGMHSGDRPVFGRYLCSQELRDTFCAGFFVMDNDTGESLHIIHAVVPEGHPQHDFTHLVHKSYPSTRVRCEVRIVCRTELFLAGLYESSAYVSRSVVQSRPCICCGREPGGDPCRCELSDIFKRPQHSFDFSQLPNILASHCFEGVGPSIAGCIKRSAAFEKPPELVKTVQDYWEDVGELVSSHTGGARDVTLVNMNDSDERHSLLRLRSMYHGEAFSNSHQRVTDIIQRATQVLIVSGDPGRGISCLLTSAKDDIGNKVDQEEGEVDTRFAALVAPEFLKELEHPKAKFISSLANAAGSVDAHVMSGPSLVHGRGENAAGSAPVCDGLTASAVGSEHISDPGLDFGAFSSPAGTSSEKNNAEDAAHETWARQRKERNRRSAVRSYRMRVLRDKLREEEVGRARATVAGLKARKEALREENLRLKSQVAELWKDHIREVRGDRAESSFHSTSP